MDVPSDMRRQGPGKPLGGFHLSRKADRQPLQRKLEQNIDHASLDLILRKAARRFCRQNRLDNQPGTALKEDSRA